MLKARPYRRGDCDELEKSAYKKQIIFGDLTKFMIDINKIVQLLLIFTVFTLSCTYQAMKITITEKINLEDVPSGSGIVKVSDNYYAIGDDVPFLYRLDNSFRVQEKISLQNVDSFTNGRIAKSQKTDFESLEMISAKEMVIFGSGSKSPQRDTFIQVLLQDTISIKTYSTKAFYSKLKLLDIFSDSELNIEAVAYRNGHIYLFNRKKNIVLDFVYENLLKYIIGSGAFPEPDITQYNLPEINGIEAGFSGATALLKQSKILFTASVENTDNAYDDGEILGSFIGVLDVEGDRVTGSYQYCEVPESRGSLKVESVTIDEEVSPSTTKVVLITDDDRGNSVLIKGIVSW